MASLLEADFAEPYKAWKQQPSQATNAAMLRAIQPSLDQITMAHVGTTNPLIMSRARQMALKALQSYDPTRSRLHTHLFNQLQGLKRAQRQQTQILHVPERIALERYHLEEAQRTLRDQLGREPSDAELSDHTALPRTRINRIRGYHPAVAEGTLAAAGEGNVFGGVVPSSQEAWLDLIYEDLAPIDQVILDHSLGRHGRPMLSNAEIADKLKKSPGLVSQRKLAIQRLLDQEDQLSPF